MNYMQYYKACFLKFLAIISSNVVFCGCLDVHIYFTLWAACEYFGTFHNANFFNSECKEITKNNQNKCFSVCFMASFPLTLKRFAIADFALND